MHIKPAVGTPRPVGEAIVDHLFPSHDDGRIPVIGITGSYGKTTVARLIAQLLTLSGKHTGLACSDGFYLDRRQVYNGDQAKWGAANRILMNRSVEAAVLENGCDVILGEGLAYDRCQVGVITNVEAARHYGSHDIETPEQVFKVMRTQVDVVLPTGAAVLNAREPMLVEMAPLCDGEVIYFSIDPELPVIISHRAQGKRAVIVGNGKIVFVTGSSEFSLAKLDDVWQGNGGYSVPEIENILAAAGAAWALGIAPALIRTGIENVTGVLVRESDRHAFELNEKHQENCK